MKRILTIILAVALVCVFSPVSEEAKGQGSGENPLTMGVNRLRACCSNNPIFTQLIILYAITFSVVGGGFGCVFCILPGIPLAIAGAIFGIFLGLFDGCLAWFLGYPPFYNLLLPSQEGEGEQEEQEEQAYIIIPVEIIKG